MADSEYIIEIASQLSGVDAASAELDALAAKLDGSGAKSAAFDDAIKMLTRDLDAAKAATAAANATLSDGRTEYAQLERAAVNAANAAERAAERRQEKERLLADAQEKHAAKAKQLAEAQSAQEAVAAQLAEAQREASEALAGLSRATNPDDLMEYEQALGAAEKRIAALSAQSAAAARRVSALSAATEAAARRVKAAGAAVERIGDARAAADQAAAAVKNYAAGLDKLEREAAQAAAAQADLERKLKNTGALQKRVADSLGGATSKLSALRGALGDIGGPLGELGARVLSPAQAFAELKEKFGQSAAVMTVAGVGAVAALAALLAAVVAVSAAMLAGVGALAAYGLAAANTARNLALTREATERLTPALRGVPWAEITDATGVADDRLRALSKSLLDAGVSAAELSATLRAAAVAEAALGQGGADALVADLAAGKVSAEEFAEAINTKLGDVAARRLLSLEAQGARFQRNVQAWFPPGFAEPALQGLSILVGLFDENTVAGRAMRDAVCGVLDPIIGQAANAAYAVEAFVLGFLIGATKIYIAAKPAVSAIADLLGIDVSGWELDSVLDAAASAGEWLAVKIGEAAVGLAVIVAVVAAGVVAFYDFSASVYATGYAIGMLAGEAAIAGLEFAKSIAGAVASAVGAVTGAVASFVTAGADMVAGLVKGILSGGASVINAAKQIAQGAVNAAKSVLGIASPSKVFAAIGDNTGAGFVQGVAAQEDAAHDAIRTLTDPKAAAPAGSSSTTTSITTSATTNAPTIIIERVEFPGANAVADFRAWLDGLALQGAT